jgi:hypothetical protein
VETQLVELLNICLKYTHAVESLCTSERMDFLVSFSCCVRVQVRCRPHSVLFLNLCLRPSHVHRMSECVRT